MTTLSASAETSSVNEIHVVAAEQVGLELDEFLCRQHPLTPKRVLRSLVRQGQVLVDGTGARPSQRLRIDQVVTVDYVEEDLASVRPAAPEEPLVCLFEDDDIFVVDKPANLLVEPDRWDASRPSLLGALHSAAEQREADQSFRPRVVHRLDKGTSGIVLVAKHVDAERHLGDAFQRGAIQKTYLALVEGECDLEDDATDVIDFPLGPAPRRNGTMRVDEEGGKPARTVISVEERFRGFTLVRCQPITGRTHQLRVHLAEIGHSLAVDPLYGRRSALLLSEIKAGYRPKPGRSESPLIERLTLHAWRLSFPADRERNGGEDVEITVEAPLPSDFERALKQLRKVRPYGRTRGPRS